MVVFHDSFHLAPLFKCNKPIRFEQFIVYNMANHNDSSGFEQFGIGLECNGVQCKQLYLHAINCSSVQYVTYCCDLPVGSDPCSSISQGNYLIKR